MYKSVVMWRYCLALHGNINNITKLFSCSLRKHFYLKQNNGLSVLHHLVWIFFFFFTDDADSIIGIFFLRAVLFLIMKSCHAVFGTKNLLFAV